ncbi:RecJ like exonuclease [Halobacteriales archaeon QS_4_69_34]|nr:MAG: RecJ like exonuclease [Halobacteriales archaeon QS_4_69_34]
MATPPENEAADTRNGASDTDRDADVQGIDAGTGIEADVGTETEPTTEADVGDTAVTGAADVTDGTVVYDLAADCAAEDAETGALYRATVNGVVPYGVFVDLAEDVSGLVHESELDGEYRVGETLVVRLIEVRENGDLGFAEVDPGDHEVVAVEHDPDIAAAGDLDATGGTVTLEGEVVGIDQTGGPTVFSLRDGTGVLPCAAFEAAGVRAYPEIERGDLVRVVGAVEEHNGGVQVEVDALDALTGEREREVREHLENQLDERAAARDVEPLIEWPAMEKLRPDLEAVATRLRRAALEGRPIKLRHHADGDGMCAAIPLELALERFVEETHADPEAPRHLLTRLPSKAPYYELEDVIRDLNHSLGDRERHGQRLPLVCMLDNGSTEEDVPAYETLAEYEVPVLAVDHHHPDPEAVAPHLVEHVNPYLHGEDYRVTTGMLCVELARMIHPEITDEVRHVPAVAGLADRSAADAMDDYIALARTAGYDEGDLRDVGDALDYAAHWLRYNDGGGLLTDVLGVNLADAGSDSGGVAGSDDADADADGSEARHRGLVAHLAERAERDVSRQLDAARPHVERATLDNGADLYRLDVERHAHRFTYPAPGKTTGAVHDRKVAETGGPAITVGYGPDFAVLRSDGVRLDIPTMVEELTAEVDGGVSGGGHLVVGSIKFVKGMREEVLDALEAKMGDAELDADLGSATVGGIEE